MAGVRKHRALPPDFERASASSTLEYEAGANMRKKNSANAKKGYNSAQRKADDAIVAAAMARHAQRKAEEAEEASKQKIADLERMLAETRSDFISTKRKAEHLSSFVPSSSSSMMTMASDGIGNLYNAMRQRHSRSSGLTISQSIIDTAASPTGPLGSHGASAALSSATQIMRNTYTPSALGQAIDMSTSANFSCVTDISAIAKDQQYERGPLPCGETVRCYMAKLENYGRKKLTP